MSQASEKEDDSERRILTKEELKPHVSCEFPLPSNQEYLSYYVYQGEWRPTKPLRPIAAMIGTPGPAVVNLPPTIGEEDHDITKNKAPAYKMGRRLKLGGFVGAGRGAGPGPNLYDVRDKTNQGPNFSRAYRIGRDSRFGDRDRTTSCQSPGPAAYTRDGGDRSVYPNAPAFSMPHSPQRGKTKIPNVPGPNEYTLPPAFGPGKTPFITGPAFSIGQSERQGLDTNVQSPGPANYLLPPTGVNMPKAPGYTMGSRAAPPIGGSSSPGPGLYYDRLVKYDKNSTRRVTFGIRHSPFKVLPGFAAVK